MPFPQRHGRDRRGAQQTDIATVVLQTQKIIIILVSGFDF